MTIQDSRTLESHLVSSQRGLVVALAAELHRLKGGRRLCCPARAGGRVPVAGTAAAPPSPITSRVKLADGTTA